MKKPYITLGASHMVNFIYILELWVHFELLRSPYVCANNTFLTCNCYQCSIARVHLEAFKKDARL